LQILKQDSCLDRLESKDKIDFYKRDKIMLRQFVKRKLLDQSKLLHRNLHRKKRKKLISLRPPLLRKLSQVNVENWLKLLPIELTYCPMLIGKNQQGQKKDGYLQIQLTILTT